MSLNIDGAWSRSVFFFRLDEFFFVLFCFSRQLPNSESRNWSTTAHFGISEEQSKYQETWSRGRKYNHAAYKLCTPHTHTRTRNTEMTTGNSTTLPHSGNYNLHRVSRTSREQIQSNYIINHTAISWMKQIKLLYSQQRSSSQNVRCIMSSSNSAQTKYLIHEGWQNNAWKSFFRRVIFPFFFLNFHSWSLIPWSWRDNLHCEKIPTLEHLTLLPACN